MSETIKKIQDYLKTNHNDLFNNDLTEKQDINKIIFGVFGSELESDDKKGYIRKQKARYIQQFKLNSLEKKNNVIICNNDSDIKDYDSVIILLQNSLQNHTLQITELQKRIMELEKNKQSESVVTNELQFQIAKNDLMDSKKARYTFYITEDNIDYLKAFCKENNNISITSVINFMINDFKNNYPIK